MSDPCNLTNGGKSGRLWKLLKSTAAKTVAFEPTNMYKSSNSFAIALIRAPTVDEWGVSAKGGFVRESVVFSQSVAKLSII